MITFTASHAGKNFGEIREQALSEPVGIERRGKVSVVVISASEYERLKGLDTRRALAAKEISADLADRLEQARMDPRHTDLDALMDEN